MSVVSDAPPMEGFVYVSASQKFPPHLDAAADASETGVHLRTSLMAK